MADLPARRTRDPHKPPVPPEVSLLKQAAGIASWRDTVDRRARVMAAVEGLLATFEAQVPPEITDPEERRSRAIELRRAYYLKLSAKASEKARLRREAKAANAAEQASS